MDFHAALNRLCMASGVSGDEGAAANVVKDLFAPVCDKVEVDAFHNVIAQQRGRHRQGLHIMLAAHLDEIGFAVSGVTADGFLNITNIGGIDPKTLPAHEVTVYGKKPLPGIVCMKPLHRLTVEEKNEATPIEETVVDVGLSRADVEAVVAIGDSVVLRSRYLQLNGKYISAKTLDNRVSVGIMREIAGELANRRLKHRLSFVSTSREETGAHGAIAAAYRLKPDLAIVFDVGQARTPDAGSFGLMLAGEGPYVTIGPQLHEGLSRRLIALCREHGIPVQIAVSGGWTGTDASAIQVVDRGIPCLLAGLPLKYMHTSVETIHLADFRNAVRMIVLLLLELDGLKEDDWHAAEVFL